jgi:plasmid maintenance system killer protein
MEINFANEKLGQDINDAKRLLTRYGQQRAKILRRRLDDLRAAATLDIMRTLPGRCHELSGDRKNQLSLDLDGPYRLIFCPNHMPMPRKPDGGLDWCEVKQITILEITDTHK